MSAVTAGSSAVRMSRYRSRAKFKRVTIQLQRDRYVERIKRNLYKRPVQIERFRALKSIDVYHDQV